MSMTIMVIEFYIYINHRDFLDEEYGLTLTEEDIAALEANQVVTRMLKKKASRGSNTFDVTDYYSYPVYEVYLRMFYAILAINSFLKILNVA